MKKEGAPPSPRKARLRRASGRRAPRESDGDRELLAPGVEAGEPARDVAGIEFVVGAEEFAESGLFVAADEEHDGERGDDGHCESGGVRAAEDDPQADPTSEEADVHGIADVAIEADYHESSGRGDWRGCATAGPAKIPDAAEGDRKTQDGGNGGKPAPARDFIGVGTKAEPAWQEPKPQCEEGGTDGERGKRGENLNGRAGGVRGVCVSGGHGEDLRGKVCARWKEEQIAIEERHGVAR